MVICGPDCGSVSLLTCQGAAELRSDVTAGLAFRPSPKREAPGGIVIIIKRDVSLARAEPGVRVYTWYSSQGNFRPCGPSG